MNSAKRARWLLVSLLVAVAGVLAHGFARRSRPSLTPAPAESTEARTPIPAPASLRPDLEKTPLAYYSDYWRQLGEGARPKILLVGASRTPAIVIEPGLAVSSPRVLDEPPETFELLGGGNDLGFALLEIAPAAAPQGFAPADSGSLQPGLLVAAVSLAADGRLIVAPGTVAAALAAPDEDPMTLENDSLELSLTFPSSFRAGAIVDLDGRLVGAAFEGGGRVRVVSSAVLLRIVERLRRRPFCHSIEVGEIDERLRELLNLHGGVIVERVRETSFLPAPSIREGDVLLQWADLEIKSPEEFLRSYEAQEPGTLVSFEVRRGRTRVRGRTVMPGADCRPAGTSRVLLSAAGMTLLRRTDGPEMAWDVLALAPGGPAARSGIAILDRILQVDGVPIDVGGLELLQSFERGPQGLAVLVRRDRRVLLFALVPHEE